MKTLRVKTKEGQVFISAGFEEDLKCPFCGKGGLVRITAKKQRKDNFGNYLFYCPACNKSHTCDCDNLERKIGRFREIEEEEKRTRAIKEISSRISAVQRDIESLIEQGGIEEGLSECLPVSESGKRLIIGVIRSTREDLSCALRDCVSIDASYSTASEDGRYPEVLYVLGHNPKGDSPGFDLAQVASPDAFGVSNFEEVFRKIT